MIELLTDLEAYFLFLCILHSRFAHYPNLNDIHTRVVNFCDLKEANAVNLFSNRMKKELTQRKRKEERFVKVKISDISIKESSKQTRTVFRIVASIGKNKKSVDIGSEDIEATVFLPYQKYDVATEKISLRTKMKIVENRLSLYAAVKSKMQPFSEIDRRTIALASLDVIDGASQLISLPTVEYKVCVQFARESPVPFETKREQEDRRQFEFANYAHNIAEHIRLYYYIFKKIYPNPKMVPVKLSKWKDSLKRSSLDILMKEHRFQCELSEHDEETSLNVVRRQMLDGGVDMKELIKVLLIQKQESKIQRTSEKLAEEEGVIEEKQWNLFSDDLVNERILTWNFGGNWFERRIYCEKFSSKIDETKLFDDIDISEEETCILVAKGFFGSSVFNRISTATSLFVFPINSILRRVSIRIYCNRHYKLFLNILTIFQMITLATQEKASMLILTIFTMDFVFGAIARGLILHRNSHLRSAWNFIDATVTLFTWLHMFDLMEHLFFMFLEKKDDPQGHRHELKSERMQNILVIPADSSDKFHNYEIGLFRFISSLRCFRLVHGLKNIEYFHYLRSIIKILLSFIPKLIPILSLLFFMIANASIIAMEYFGRSYYQTCMTTNHPEGSNDYFVDHFADHHPCSNSSDIFTYQCPEGFHCINYDKEKLIRRQNLELNFDRIDTTLILLLFMLSTEDYDPFYYRIVFQNGIIGFVSCAFMLMFGLYVLALMLALIYDTYENEMKMRKVMSKIHYFDGEYEFPFNVQSSELCEYEMLYSNKQYKNIVHRQVSTKPKATLPRSSVIETSFDTMRETMRLLSLFYGVKEAYVLRYPKQLMKSALQLRKVVESKEFIGMINFLIAFQFVILLFYHDKSEFLSAISWCEFVITICFLTEALLKIIAYGVQYFLKAWNIFDFTILLFNVVAELNRSGINFLYFLSYFRSFRILHLMIEKWGAMKEIMNSIRKCLRSVLTTFVVFLFIFAYFTFVTHSLFNTFQGKVSPLNLLDFWLGFNDITTSLRTVFMILFPSAWQETMRQFVDRVKHYFVEEEDLLIYRYTFIETFPYGMFFFIALGHLYSLMFSDLLIPQLFSELNIDVLYGSSAEKKVTISEADRELQITTETPTTYILNVIPFNRKILFYGDSKIRERVKGVWWRKLMLVLLTIETVSTYVDNHWLKEQPEYFNIWLNFRLIVQAIFLFDLLLRLLGDGIYFFMYSRKTSTYAWKSIVVLVDVLTLTCSIFDIILSVSQGPSYRGHQYINIGVSLICLRLVSRTHRLRLWIQTMITNWRGIVNALLFAAFVIALYAITGVQAFGGKMEQCYLRRARAYTWMSYRISLTRPDMNTWEACKQDEDQTSDKFMNKVTYVFNFDNTLDGFQTVLQLIYGDDIWGTIGALTSINTLGEVPKRWANPNAWFFIVAVIFGGFIIDTLIFAVVASNVADKNSIPEDSVWRIMDDESRMNTFLALESLKSISPWHIMQKPKSILRKAGLIIISHKLYDHFMLLMMVLDLLLVSFDMLDINEKTEKLELVFLIFYCVDSIMRILIVGKGILEHPNLVFFDICLPFFLLSVFHSNTNILIKPSLLIMLRLGAPDRYIRFEFLNRGKLILKALVSSINEQFYMIIAFFFFLMAFGRIGIGIFDFNDLFGAMYSHIDTPPVYTTLPTAVSHLFCISLGTFFDISIINMNLRSEFCKRNVKFAVQKVAKNFLIQKLILDLEETEMHTFISCRNNTFKIHRRDLHKIFDGAKDYFDQQLEYHTNEIFDFEETKASKLLEKLMEREIRKETNLWKRKNWCDRTLNTPIIFQKAIDAIANIEQTHQCAQNFEIRLFYFIFVAIAKFFILNMLKSIVLEQYKREKRRFDNNLTEYDIIDFISKWQTFSQQMGDYGSYIPIRYVTYFSSVNAPKTFQIVGNSEEEIQMTLVKYKLPVREKDMYVHVLDMLVVSIANSFNCDPSTDLRLMIRNLAPYISRVFPDYGFDSVRTIKMGDYLKGYYCGKLLLNAFVQIKITGDLLIKMKTATHSKHYFEALARKASDVNVSFDEDEFEEDY